MMSPAAGPPRPALDPEIVQPTPDENDARPQPGLSSGLNSSLDLGLAKAERLGWFGRQLRWTRVLAPRFVGSIRTRLVGIVLIAAIPLLILSGTIAFQNYRLALGTSAEEVGRLRESALARHVAAIEGVEQTLQALSNTGLVSGGEAACRSHLEAVLALRQVRYASLRVVDGAGQLRCGAGDERVRSGGAAATPAAEFRKLLADAASSQQAVLGAGIRAAAATAPQDASDGWVIPLATPLPGPGPSQLFLVAEVRIGWFANAAHPLVPALDTAWLRDPAGTLIPVTSSSSSELPPPGVLKQLFARPDIIDALSTGGAPFAYASAPLGGSYQLLVAYPAAHDREAARELLGKRLFQLAMLLLLGLAAIAIGAHIALVEPLDQFGRAVAAWRRGGVFDESSIQDPPLEVRELAASFGEATRALSSHEARHRVAVEQQDLLMKEIHHRVKNNLQIVASLLNLQASRIRQPEARAEFASARDRVRALSTLHRHLYAEGEVHSINMRSFLTELCGQLFDAMGEKQGKRIELTIEASETLMSSDQAVPLSLIVTEAVSNALKYAFPAKRTGHVHVRFTSEGDVAELVVQDDGIGIPAGRADTEMGPRDGIGITLIRGFARQLGGELIVVENGGTLYRLRMTLRRARLEGLNGDITSADAAQ